MIADVIRVSMPLGMIGLTLATFAALALAFLFISRR